MSKAPAWQTDMKMSRMIPLRWRPESLSLAFLTPTTAPNNVKKSSIPPQIGPLRRLLPEALK